ncbi:hypothetical protein MBLNU230_g2975t1 [Neophaeotheca triangularis]
MHREVSPALSETEVDISKNLFQDGGFDSEDEPAGEVEAKVAKKHKRNPVTSSAQDEESSEEDEAFIAATQAAANKKSTVLGGKTAKKAGAFQTMGLNTHLLKAITKKGFSVPTPIQRKTIPVIMDGQDVVGMARTGSGKTAAFVIPMIEKLKSHSAKVGARAIVLSPSRELALQTLKVIKELGRGTDLRTTLLVGGDSLEDQFSSMASNPDIIIATPGRFEHLKVEMSLELSSVQYVVFDEADRLFEMGFAAQLAEIMHSLPSSRQTLLFSATLPKSLVEFARAGLQDPKLVRLDAESKVSPDLQSAFFTVKAAEKEGALIHLLEEVIKMPTGPTEASIKAQENAKKPEKKRKRGADGPDAKDMPSKHSTVIFAATKHHVEYLNELLKLFGYSTSYVYGALDQTARKIQVQEFRAGLTNILIVTDVAARGLDIPILANVINYDFPSQPKIFVHRVGRTARAGKSGWSYSLIGEKDMPYLLDLQLFLSRKLTVGRAEFERDMFKNTIVVGSFVRDGLERCIEEVGVLLHDNEDLQMQRDVAAKGEKQYLRTRNPASAESVKRVKQLNQDDSKKGANMLFHDDNKVGEDQARQDLLAKVSGFRPQETIFELGRKGAQSEAAEIMRNRRAKVMPKHRMKEDSDEEQSEFKSSTNGTAPADKTPATVEEDSDDDLVLTRPDAAGMEDASDNELELTFTAPTEQNSNKRRKGAHTWQDTENFMSYTPTSINLTEDKGYGVQSGGYNPASSNFVTQAAGATMDLANDESKALGDGSSGGTKAKGMRWDKKSKKYVRRENDEDGSKGSKYIVGESGQRIPASFRSGRFDAWRKANRLERLPRVGEQERANSAAHVHNGGGGGGQQGAGGKRFKHKQEKAPKAADRYRDDYEARKKKVESAKEAKRGRFADGGKEGKGKSELRGVDDVRKMRRGKEKRREKNARPQRKGK